MNILIAEDEPKIRDVLTAYFQNEGWHVMSTGNGNEAISIFRMNSIDLVVLDLMLDGMQGEIVCRQIREISNVPLIMLTSKARENDAITGLDLGADHYVTKPFRVKELVAQIRALLRRANSTPALDAAIEALTFNNKRLMLNVDAQDVYVEGKPANLTTTEFGVIRVLIEHPGRVISRSDLSFQVLGYRYIGDGRAIDAHIKNIRKKIEADPGNPIYILTKVGAGYRFGFQRDGDPS